ncbi:MAG: endolytic transglycosylase MltG [Lachnospiraceae bacterium]|nr:endolytic transglycosylase MltG [Lachnospiraceae bacterium]
MRTKTATMSILSVVVQVMIVLTVVIVIYAGAMKCYDFGYKIFTDTPMSLEPGRDVTIIVNEGSSTRQVGDLLEENKLIPDGTVFVVQEKLSEYAGEMKPGVYVLNTSMTAEKMIAVMSGNLEEEKEEETE